jgi:hypothetical protein
VAAFVVCGVLVSCGGQKSPEVNEETRIRKQVGELTVADLERYAVWEFAIDEEGFPGQDEETVKPRPELERADPNEGIFVVRAQLVARDGTEFDGHVTASEEPELGYVQPTVITPDGHVSFWFGIREPSAEDIKRAYRNLDLPKERLFPLRYQSVVDAGAASEGEVAGFYYYADAEAGKIARKN